MKRNPKQEGSVLFDCIPQVGPCPMNCNQCFYNRPNAFYVPIDEPHFPDVEEVGDGVVRVNCGNDSNNDRDYVVRSTEKYLRRFFNTSIPKFDFPGPVVFTANPKEEDVETYNYPDYDFGNVNMWFCPSDNIMFIRVRTSATNLDKIEGLVSAWTDAKVPVVITMMAYYDHEPEVPGHIQVLVGEPCYQWKVRHINSYWCPTPAFTKYVMSRFKNNRLVALCGSVDGGWCRNCRNCETHFVQAEKRLRGE